VKIVLNVISAGETIGGRASERQERRILTTRSLQLFREPLQREFTHFTVHESHWKSVYQQPSSIPFPDQLLHNRLVPAVAGGRFGNGGQQVPGQSRDERVGAEECRPDLQEFPHSCSQLLRQVSKRGWSL